jgi:hypothetical protein
MEVEVGFNLILDAMNDIAFAEGKPPDDVGVFTRGPSSLSLTFEPWTF